MNTSHVRVRIKVWRTTNIIGNARYKSVAIMIEKMGKLQTRLSRNIILTRKLRIRRFGWLPTNIESHLICFEIGNRGVVSKDNKTQIRKILKFVGEKACKDIVKPIGTHWIVWCIQCPIRPLLDRHDVARLKDQSSHNIFNGKASLINI